MEPHVFAYTKSMVLWCAVELGIPDTIHCRAGSAMVPNLVAELSLRRLMRLLSHTGVFDAESNEDELDTYGLTLISAPGTGLILSPFVYNAACCIPSLFPCPCHWRRVSAPHIAGTS